MKKTLLLLLVPIFFVSCDIDRYTSANLGMNRATLDSMTVRGNIVMKYTGKPISGATVVLKRFSTVSGTMGNYSLTVPYYQDYDRGLSVFLSAKAYKYSHEKVLLTPEPNTLYQNIELLYYPPIISGLILTTLNNGEEVTNVFSTIITDYEGVENIQSAHIECYVNKGNDLVFKVFPLHQYDQTSDFTGLFKTDDIHYGIDAKRRTIHVFATDFGGWSDTTIFPPGTY